jgi:hypothetical protein
MNKLNQRSEIPLQWKLQDMGKNPELHHIIFYKLT